MVIHVERPKDVDEFLARAGDFLETREAEHNLLFGICVAIRTTPELFIDDPPRFWVAIGPDGAVACAALRTPPNNLVLSEADDSAARDALVDAVASEPLPGVLGPAEWVGDFASRWGAAAGRPARLEDQERIFRLDRVRQVPYPVSGRWRAASPEDRDVIARWIVAFVREALPGDEAPTLEEAAGAAGRWIAGLGRRAYLWENDGRPVSLVGAGGETPNGVRIGPVYTPPEERGHGYATALTAAASQDQLDRGRRFCFLFTDLGNPTSNKIYQAIGYRPVRDVDKYRFDSDA